MLAPLGQLTLIFINSAAAALGFAAFRGSTKVSLLLAYAIAFLGSVSFAVLIYAHAISDFSLLNVAENSHTLKPMLYKITGTWGNHEGSMLLFLTLLCWCTGGLAIIGRDHYLKALIPQSILVLGLGLFILITSNPFTTLYPVPKEGMGLNPLLQDIGLAFHPPILYAGYMGLSLVFSLAIAILLDKRTDSAWSKLLLSCTLVPWAFLTGGVALGSWWAYRELGWGGFWFWDPVENASLMPWLLATALTHTLILAHKRESFSRISLLLAIFSFVMALYGTFLVRSGILTSVHAFASSPERGLFILGFITLILTSSLILYVLRIRHIPDRFQATFWSRDVSLAAQAFCLIIACATIILATLYPIVSESLTGVTVSVGSPYFALTFVPLAAFTVFITGIGPLIAWKKQDIQPWLQKALPAFGISLGLSFLTCYIMGDYPLRATILLICGWWLIISTLQAFILKFKKTRRASGNHYAMILGHLGIGVLMVAITIAVTWSKEYFGYVREGAAIELYDFSVTLNHVRIQPGPNYISQVASYTAQRNHHRLGNLTAERRYYPVENSTTTEAALYSTPFYDLYLALGMSPFEGLYQTRIYYKPAINFIWFGALLIVMAGFVSFIPKKK